MYSVADSARNAGDAVEKLIRCLGACCEADGQAADGLRRDWPVGCIRRFRPCQHVSKQSCCVGPSARTCLLARSFVGSRNATSRRIWDDLWALNRTCSANFEGSVGPTIGPFSVLAGGLLHCAFIHGFQVIINTLYCQRMRALLHQKTYCT